MELDSAPSETVLPSKGGTDVLALLARIAGLIFETQQPLEHAIEIVRQTALSHSADISTLFVVQDRARIGLEAGVAYFRGEEVNLPRNSYELNWEISGQEGMRGKGLTGYVAVSGQTLRINSYEELRKQPAHNGRWDEVIYPEGPDHPESGFGCLYAVPLRRSQSGAARDTVIGVFKIERRAGRPCFNDEECRLFDLVAAHLSLILQNYSQMQYRVFSDVAHAIGGGLGRSYQILTTCEYILDEAHDRPEEALDYLREHLPSAVYLMNKAVTRLNVVVETSRDPHRHVEQTIRDLWHSVRAEVELKSNLSPQEVEKVQWILPHPLSADTWIRLRAIEYHDLCSLLGNLLDNAIRHSGKVDSVQVEMSCAPEGGLAFRIADRGPGVPLGLLLRVEHTNYSDIYRMPHTQAVSGTGLLRVYGLANHNAWKISHATSAERGTEFRLLTRDYRRPSEGAAGNA